MTTDHKLPLLAAMLAGCLAASAAAGARDAAAPAATPPAPAPAQCWSITGPHYDGRETYFDASNKCDVPYHCRVWVNWEEPPHQVHLEPGTRGRIDVGGTEGRDKFSHDCVPVGLRGEPG